MLYNIEERREDEYADMEVRSEIERVLKDKSEGWAIFRTNIADVFVGCRSLTEAVCLMCRCTNAR